MVEKWWWQSKVCVKSFSTREGRLFTKALCVSLSVCVCGFKFCMFWLLIFIQLVVSVTPVLNGSHLSNIFYILLGITAAECDDDTNITNPVSARDQGRDVEKYTECFPLTSNFFVSFIHFNSSFIHYGFYLTLPIV